MKPETLDQMDTCKSCGTPYGNPLPEMAATRSYCERCANLPGNIMAVLELQCKQLARKAREARGRDRPNCDTAAIGSLRSGLAFE